MATELEKPADPKTVRAPARHLAASLFGLTCGATVCVGCEVLGDSFGGVGLVNEIIRKSYEAVGSVIVGLVPLLLWSARLMVQQFLFRSAAPALGLDYAYISRTATQLGLLGTVISLVLATSPLAAEVTIGTTQAILKVLPLTGQALVSTVVGLVIAIIADTALHFRERKEALR